MPSSAFCTFQHQDTIFSRSSSKTGKSHLLFTFLFVASSVVFLNAQTLPPPVAPVNVIIDSDMAHNADDAGDQAMMWALSAQGQVNVLAVIISSTNDYSAPVAHVIATYYGHPNVPIGANHSNIPNDYASYGSYYTQQVAARFGNPSDTRANYPDAVTVYRQALATAPSNSVYILSGGYYYPLMQLLQSGPDSTSPLTGMQLVAQKVARLIIVAGSFPDSGTTDRGNMLIDPDSGSYVVANWPGELDWMPDDQAWNTYTGPGTTGANADPTRNPVAYAYELYCNGGGSVPDQTYCANNTPGWAQLGELFTVYGLGTNFVVGGLNGSTVVWDSTTSAPGRIIWSQTPNRNQSYLLLNPPGADLSSIIDPLIQWVPGTGPITQPPVANSQSVTVSGASATITLTATDPQGAPLTYQAVTQPLHGVLSGTAPNLMYTPNSGYAGADSFTFTADNGVFTSNVATVSITVSSVQPPVANSQSVISSFGAAVVITLTATDPNNNSLTYSVVSQPQHGSLTGTPPNVTYTPTPGYSGSDSFTFLANNGFVNSNVATVTITVTQSSPLPPPVAPVNVIIDSDMAHNADDAGDQAMMWALSAQGQVNVLAVIISSTNDYSAPVAHVIATYYGHPNVPIGANHSNIPNDYASYGSYYTQQVAARFGNPSDTRANYPDAVTVYRQALATAPSNSVYILSGGYYYPLMQLLQSGPDSTSPLTGMQLVAQKVARLIIVAGSFPDSGTTDRGNMLIDPDSGSYVVANWPGELDWMPDDQAWNTYTGPGTTGANADPTRNPVAYAYELYCNGGGSVPDQTYCANNTPGWAQLGELFTVYGLGTNFVVGGLNGSTVVWDSTTSAPGRIIWSQTPNRNQSYLLLNPPGADLSSIIDPLIQWVPSPRQSQAITFGALPGRTYGDPPFTVSAIASSGLPVSFTVGATDNCSISGATVTVTAAGTCTVTAHQPGNSSYSAAPDVAQSFAITKATASIQLSGLNTTYDGTPKSVTATTTPSGLAVSITYNGSTTAPSNAGSYAVGATITDNNYQGTAGGTLVIAAASTTVALSSSRNPSSYGQSVTFTATVSGAGGTQTGTVTFYDGANILGTGTLSSGSSVLSTTALSAATHTITALYGGGNNFQGSTSPALSQVVNPAPTTTRLTSSPNPSALAQAVTLTATLSATNSVPSGTVTFYDGTNTLGSTQAGGSGQATLVVATLAVGSHSLTATYATSGNWLGSTSTVRTQTVNRASSTTTLTSSVNPASVGQAVTFAARVTTTSAIATGTIQFRDGSTNLATVTLDSTGQASFTTTTLAPGNHTMRAVYSGDGNFQSSTSSSLTQTVNASTTTTLISSRNPSTRGQTVTFTATVTAVAGTPTGTVTFRAGTTSLGSRSLNSSGQASLSTSGLSRGSHSITATYGGATGYPSSVSAPLTQQVN